MQKKKPKSRIPKNERHEKCQTREESVLYSRNNQRSVTAMVSMQRFGVGEMRLREKRFASGF